MKETITCTCFVCGGSFEWGHDSYATGRKVPGWKEMICAGCDQWDGVYPSPDLEAKLTAKAVEITYNSQGFIVVPR